MGFINRVLQSLRTKTLTTAQAGPLFTGPTKSGQPVNESTALGLSALWCGLRTISQDLGCLDPAVYNEDDSGIRTKDKKHKLNRLFCDPNPEMTGIVFRETLQFHALLWGNAFAEIVRDGAGNPVQLWPIHPQHCQVYRDSESGTLTYRVTVAPTGGPPGSLGQQIELQPSNILHVPGLSPDGSVGFRLLSIARETIGFGQAACAFGAGMFKNGVRPSGMLETPNQLSEQARNNLRDSYNQLHAGADNTGKLMLLEEGLKFTQSQYTNEQSQYIEILDRIVFEVARFLVIPPPKLMALEQATWNNITELNRAYLNDCLRPWLEKWEAEYDRKLLLPSERDAKYIEFDTSTLLRADEKTRYANYDLALAHQPWRTVDEVRAAENLPPMPKTPVPPPEQEPKPTAPRQPVVSAQEDTEVENGDS
jgi:HK97 family phage portal protein